MRANHDYFNHVLPNTGIYIEDTFKKVKYIQISQKSIQYLTRKIVNCEPLGKIQVRL